jgi:NTP pyrophosphatase (non-canonical NTP hydrolase)
MSDFKDLVARANEIRERYRELERQKYGREWAPRDHAIGFVGDVGELMQLVGAKEGVRDIEDVDAKLAHELADCLWSVIVLANDYGVDLEKEFLATMDKLETRIAKEKQS